MAGHHETKAEIAHALAEEISRTGDHKKKHGIALVGLGRSGRFHLTSIKALPELTRLLYAIDRDEAVAKKVAAETGAKWATSIDAALADEAVNIVIIASTTDTHFPFIMAALKAGKAVFTEKPISHDVGDVQKAVDLAKQMDLPFVCGYQRRCDSNFRALKAQLDEGAVGRVKVVKSCSRDNPVPPLEYLRTSGGIFHDMLIHDFDVQEWLLGETPESVLAVGHCYEPEIAKMDDLDTVAVMLKYPSGVVAMVDTCRDAAYGYDQRVEVFGSKGMLTAKNEMTSTVELATAAGHLMPPAEWSFPERYKHAYTVELSEFVALVEAGPKSEAHRLEQKAMMRHPRVVKVAEAAEYSWRLNRQVLLSEDLGDLKKELEAKRGTPPRSA